MGRVTIEGRSYDKVNGTRQEVWDRIAYKTRGGLTRGSLTKDGKTGKIKSIKASRAQARVFANGNPGASALLRNRGNFQRHEPETMSHNHSHSHSGGNVRHAHGPPRPVRMPINTAQKQWSWPKGRSKFSK